MTKPKKPAASPKIATSPTKKELVLALLRRDGGATLSEIVKASGWQPHSSRAVLTGFRKQGFTIGKTKVDGVTCYAITGEPAA